MGRGRSAFAGGTPKNFFIGTRTHFGRPCILCTLRYVRTALFWDKLFNVINTGGSPYPQIQYPRFTAARKNFGKLKKLTVHKFQNAHQAKTGPNMVKSSSPGASSTWLIFLCPRTHASPQTCHHSASKVLAVWISYCVIAVFVFRKQQEEWRSRWIPTAG